MLNNMQMKATLTHTGFDKFASEISLELPFLQPKRKLSLILVLVMFNKIVILDSIMGLSALF